MLGAVALAAVAAPLRAQLRPLDPLDWSVYEGTNTVSAAVGGSIFWDQGAAMSATRGRLLELPGFSLTWRSARMAMEATGTGLRVFDVQSVFGQPDPHAGPPASPGERRTDAGDFRLGALARLTPDRFPFIGLIRFGTRLPSHNTRKGLDRHRPDFYGVVGVRTREGPVVLSGETGILLNSTFRESHELADLLHYVVTASYDRGPVIPSITVLGQATGATFQIRGTNNLAEARLGLQVGRRNWFRAAFVHGFEPFSPRGGLMVMAGTTR